MRFLILSPFCLVMACATSTPEHQAGPLPGSDASTKDAQGSDADGPPDAFTSDSEPEPWPGSCVDGEKRDCYTGAPETKNVGACKTGTTVCVDGKFSTTCTGEMLPSGEACNGIDDNCDGTIDEGCSCTDGDKKDCYGGPAGTQGVGICKGGSQVCSNGVWGLCEGAVLPSSETCNGLDDDCNGLVDDKAGLRLYTLPFDSNAWTSKYLSEEWVGTNAPPACANVVSTVQLTDIGRLLVFTSDGKLYWRKHGTWMMPTTRAAKFPGLPAFETVYEVPDSLYGNPPLGGFLTFSAIPEYYRYQYDYDDVVTYIETGTMTDGTHEGGPDQNTWPSRWVVERFNPVAIPDQFWLIFEYDNRGVYIFDGTFTWKAWPTAQSPLWAGKSNPPPVNQCVAGYADAAPDVAYLLCP